MARHLSWHQWFSVRPSHPEYQFGNTGCMGNWIQRPEQDCHSVKEGSVAVLIVFWKKGTWCIKEIPPTLKQGNTWQLWEHMLQRYGHADLWGFQFWNVESSIFHKACLPHSSKEHRPPKSKAVLVWHFNAQLVFDMCALPTPYESRKKVVKERTADRLFYASAKPPSNSERAVLAAACVEDPV